MCVICTSAEGQTTAIQHNVLKSPNGNLQIDFHQTGDEGHRRMYYSVNFYGKTVIKESELDLRLDNNLSEKAMALQVDTHQRWFENLKVTGVVTSSKDSLWKPVYGEQAQIRDCYNAATIAFVKDDNPIYIMYLEIRAYDEGAAIRYRFSENPKGTYYNITSENTEFSLPAGTMAWFANWAQAPYQKLPLKNWPGESERPLTLELPGGIYACLAEAQMVDYARAKFRLSNDKPNTLVTSMAGEAALISPVATPWRVIMVANSPGVLIENNSLLLNLNPPNQIQNSGWIKPGKIMRVMNLTTAEAKANIDFAAQQGLQYILFDWKWYGPAFSFSSDATKVAIPDFDLPGIIQYGSNKGIGVWLYVNQQALLAQSDSLFTYYKKWGVKGVKFGFVQVGSHRWTTWLEKAIHQAADQQIMVNIHDDWRPTGEQRTWPNLMTAEGIRGNEEMPDATHNTVLPFTRYIAGAADYTICYFDKRIKTTHAHQLALAAVYYSPIQTLFWYDRPSQYHGEPELDYWKKIPTSWDETKVIAGLPGQYIATARRSKDDWYVGIITNNDARKLSLRLDFLNKDSQYTATIYSDDPGLNTTTHVKVRTVRVNYKSVLQANLFASGGEAIYLTPSK
ncbi:glycoside hydrolase family 97 N-terminal domain-containing protein [Mucilaginibacter sp. PAMB04274]|uniref:glycoside hydrolase family 97 protein n=1 Tax=Mucilaginibacter sp. PAMB04274 TaxID=3138568 RepID=UPI0033338411